MKKESRLIKSMKTVPQDASYAVLIRHAERQVIEMSSDFGDSVSITEKGVMESSELGRITFMGNLDGVFSSPLPRCVQTASAIIKAAGLDSLAISTKNTLGRPGSYIDDPQLAGKHFLTRDSRSIIRGYMDGGKLDGFLSLNEGSKRLISDVLCDFSPTRSSNLYVSHDAVIMPFISYYTGEKFSKEWLDFLDGVIITLQDGHVKMVWDGEPYSLEGF
jgi:broad specificity phosphatase PhoE